ncbi:hypothetical protein [Salmonella phage SD-2_S15]|nr:hypothetical protein [Salmonella phage SD-2_S15]
MNKNSKLSGYRNNTLKYNDIKYWVDPYLNKSLLMYRDKSRDLYGIYVTQLIYIIVLLHWYTCTACIIQNNY